MVLDDTRMPVPRGGGIVCFVFPGAGESWLARQFLNFFDTFPQTILVESAIGAFRSAAAAMPLAGNGGGVACLLEQLTEAVMEFEQLTAAVFLRYLQTVVIGPGPIAGCRLPISL